MVRDLTEVLSSGDVACVALAQDASLEADADLEKRLVDICHGQDIAVVIENDWQKAASLGADGVHLGRANTHDIEAYEKARAALGPDRIVGVFCGNSRHDAMILGEAGADYVAFGPDGASEGEDDLTSLLSWWSELFQPPCVAWGISTFADAAKCAQADADFVALDTVIWGHEDGASAGVKSFVSSVG